jgi:hypothetical protein
MFAASRWPGNTGLQVDSINAGEGVQYLQREAARKVTTFPRVIFLVPFPRTRKTITFVTYRLKKTTKFTRGWYSADGSPGWIKASKIRTGRESGEFDFNHSGKMVFT